MYIIFLGLRERICKLIRSTRSWVPETDESLYLSSQSLYEPAMFNPVLIILCLSWHPDSSDLVGVSTGESHDWLYARVLYCILVNIYFYLDIRRSRPCSNVGSTYLKFLQIFFKINFKVYPTRQRMFILKTIIQKQQWRLSKNVSVLEI